MDCGLTDASGMFIYLDSCPRCGGEIPEPFARGSLQRHRHFDLERQEACRLVVLADPLADEHVVRVLSEEETYEQVMREMRPLYLNRFKRYLHLEAACQLARVA